MALAGCSAGPRAPALQDDPVYQNNREGFRFLVPDGWTQSARGEAPSGPATQEQMLVEYRLIGAEQPAAFRVTLVDLPAGTDLEGYFKTRWPAESWTSLTAAEPLEVDGRPGTHAAFASKEASAEQLQEVFAFQRGERAYLFVGLAAPTDTKARQQVRRAVESLHWKH
jgi:hypothetical protein